MRRGALTLRLGLDCESRPVCVLERESVEFITELFGLLDQLVLLDELPLQVHDLLLDLVLYGIQPVSFLLFSDHLLFKDLESCLLLPDVEILLGDRLSQLDRLLALGMARKLLLHLLVVLLLLRLDSGLQRIVVLPRLDDHLSDEELLDAHPARIPE